MQNNAVRKKKNKKKKQLSFADSIRTMHLKVTKVIKCWLNIALNYAFKSIHN